MRSAVAFLRIQHCCRVHVVTSPDDNWLPSCSENLRPCSRGPRHDAFQLSLTEGSQIQCAQASRWPTSSGHTGRCPHWIQSNQRNHTPKGSSPGALLDRRDSAPGSGVMTVPGLGACDEERLPSAPHGQYCSVYGTGQIGPAWPAVETRSAMAGQRQNGESPPIPGLSRQAFGRGWLCHPK
jgi:hypothetical protein